MNLDTQPDKAAALAYAMQRLASGQGTIRKPKERHIARDPKQEHSDTDVKARRTYAGRRPYRRVAS